MADRKEANITKGTVPDSLNWWERFKAAVEDPNTRLYDFLRHDVRNRLEMEDEEGFSYLLQRAQKKAIKQALELTNPKELRDALKRLEKNRLFFDYRSRVGIKLFRVVMDTYIVALHGEQKTPPNAADALAIHDQVEKIIEEELEDPEVVESVEMLAEELTHEEKEEIRETVEDAQKQLKERSSVSRMADDVISLGKTFLKPDTMANFTIHALPLITWKYRWALALGLGAFSARKSVYHMAVGAKALVSGDRSAAREEGTKALKALRAAGGNVLAVGLTPVYAKLPKALIGFGVFFADKVYNTALDVTHKIINRPAQLEVEKKPLKTRFKNGIKGFFNDNQDTLASLTIKALKIEIPHKLTKSFADASKRMTLSTARRVGGDIYSMGRTVISRSFNRLANICPAYEPSEKQNSAEDTNDTAADVQDVLVEEAVLPEADDTPSAPKP